MPPLQVERKKSRETDQDRNKVEDGHNGSLFNKKLIAQLSINCLMQVLESICQHFFATACFIMVTIRPLSLSLLRSFSNYC